MKKFLFALFALFACSIASAENKFNDVVPYEAGKVSIQVTPKNESFIDIWVYNYQYGWNTVKGKEFVPIYSERAFTKRLSVGQNIISFESENYIKRNFVMYLIVYDAETGEVTSRGWNREIDDLDGCLLKAF